MVHTKNADAMLQQMFDRIDAVCGMLGTDCRALELLKDFDNPYERRVRLNFPRLHPDPKIREIVWESKTFKLIRVQYLNPWSTGQQPYGGGLRFDPGVSMPLMKLDAMKMLFKHTLVGPHDHDRIPFGGAKGGVNVDPRSLSRKELILLTQAVVQKLDPIIGPHVDRVAPDMGTNEVIMDEFMTHYATLNRSRNIPCGAIASGKSLANFGCPGRLEATAAGMLDVFGFFREHSSYKRYFTQPMTAIIIGCGNVGGNLLKLMKGHGVSVVGIADIDGALYRPQGGLEQESDAILALAKGRGGIRSYDGADHVTVEELMAQPCSVLVPAASEGMITRDVAQNMKANILLEGANNPTDEDALPILNDKDVLVIPDILANAGGATVSYFEWLQGVRGQKYELEEIEKQRKAYLVGGAKRTVEAAKKFGTDLRTGAMIASIDFIAQRLKSKHHWD